MFNQNQSRDANFFFSEKSFHLTFVLYRQKIFPFFFPLVVTNFNLKNFFISLSLSLFAFLLKEQ